MLITTLAASALAPVALGQSGAVKLTRTKTYDGVRAVAVAASPRDSRFIACLENGQVRIMDAAGKIPTVNLSGHVQPAYAAAFSPDGATVVTGDEQAKIFVWNAKTGAKVREFPREKGHGRGIQSITFSADGKQILTVGKDDAIAIWNLSGGHPVVKITGEPTNFYGAFFTSSGSVWTGTQKEGLRLLAPKTLSTAAKFTLPGGQGSNGFAMNRRGTLGATAGRDGQVTLFDLTKRTRLAAMAGHSDYVTAVDFTPSGSFLGTSSIDGTVRLWNVASRKEVAKIENRSYVGSPVAFTGDGKFMICTNGFDTVEAYSVSPAQPAPAPARRRR